MKRHRFEPASLVMGLVLFGLMTAFILDASGVWSLKPKQSVTMTVAGLLLALVSAVLTQIVRAVRGRRSQNRRPA